VCALPFGVTTAPNNYSATIAVGKAGSAGPSVTVALTAGRHPPGLSLSPPYGSGDAVIGLPYQGHLLASHKAGGALSVVSGSLPPGLSLQTFASPRDANDELAGTPAKAGTYTFTMRLTDYPGQQATQAARHDRAACPGIVSRRWPRSRPTP
jgi:hypothetical protein